MKVADSRKHVYSPLTPKSNVKSTKSVTNLPSLKLLSDPTSHQQNNVNNNSIFMSIPLNKNQDDVSNDKQRLVKQFYKDFKTTPSGSKGSGSGSGSSQWFESPDSSLAYNDNIYLSPERPLLSRQSSDRMISFDFSTTSTSELNMQDLLQIDETNIDQNILKLDELSTRLIEKSFTTTELEIMNLEKNFDKIIEEFSVFKSQCVGLRDELESNYPVFKDKYRNFFEKFQQIAKNIAVLEELETKLASSRKVISDNKQKIHDMNEKVDKIELIQANLKSRKRKRNEFIKYMSVSVMVLVVSYMCVRR